MTNPLNIDLLQRSLKAVTHDERDIDKLVWAFRDGGRIERMLQFDWAFHLQRELRKQHPDLWTACELNRIDIAIRNARTTSDSACELRAGIELKVWGNWWVSEIEIDAYESDVEKIFDSKTPSVAVAICIFAEPKDKNDPEFGWLAPSSKSNCMNSMEALENRINEKSRRGLPKYRFVIDLEHPSFSELSMWVDMTFNDAH